MNIKTSIVIPTYKHLDDLLKPCIESIIKNTDLTNVEVIVCENGVEETGTREYVNSLNEMYQPGAGAGAEIIQPFKYIWTQGNIGFTNNANIGLKAAQGDAIILMNNDVKLLDQPKNSWLDRLVSPLKDNVGITCPLKIWSEDAEREFAIFFLVCIRKDMLEKVGYLDTIFSPGYGEDIDFCIRVEQAGYQVKAIATNGGVVNGMNTLDYPVYHGAEKTMLDDEHKVAWYKQVEKNKKILQDRFKLPRGWFYGQDIEEYRRLIEDMPNGGTMCELGPAAGRSLCSVADIIKRKNIKITAVDTFQGTVSERRPGQLPDEYMQEFLDNCKRFGIEVNAIRGWTNEVHKQFANETFDLIFLDCDHQYESVKEDLKNWEHKVKKGGIFCGHDYVSWEGVGRALNERYDRVRVYGTVWSKRI